MARDPTDIVDHLVYATPDLEASIAELEERTGVRAAPGGQHPGRGTRNALIALSDQSYLEIIGPDPAQTDVPRPWWFGVDKLVAPTLTAWAARTSRLDTLVAEAARAGVHLGKVAKGHRKAASGALLSWRFTDPTVVIADGLVPFFIDWGPSPHPASTAPTGATLKTIRGEHPDPGSVRRVLAGMEIEMQIDRGDRPRLIAVLGTPKGEVTLT